VHLIGFIIRIYHNARSSECQIHLNFIATYQCLSYEVWMTERCLCDWHDQTGVPASAAGSGPPTHGGGSVLLELGQVEEQISGNPPCLLGSREWKELHSSTHKLYILIITLMTCWNTYWPFSNETRNIQKFTGALKWPKNKINTFSLLYSTPSWKLILCWILIFWKKKIDHKQIMCFWSR